VNPSCEIDAAGIVAAHRERYATLVVEDNTQPVRDLAVRAERKGLDGAFVRALQERLAQAATADEQRVVELALQAGLSAIDNREPILRVD
jgi:ActR/RegA family two-component response regulator